MILASFPKLLASVAATALFAVTAPTVAQKTDFKATVEADANILMEADELTYDAEAGIVRAIGRVNLKRDGFELLAGEITYNQKTGEAVASGAVELKAPGGERIFAPRLTLNEQLKTALIEDFQLLFLDNSRAAAASGTYDEETKRSTLNRAAFSPCDVCDEDGNDTRPIWQIKAVRVIHDRGKRRLYYKNAYLEMFGVPVLWAPAFSHPDSTVDRQSGVLAPRFKLRDELGVMVSVPYYFAISEDKDATVTPSITTREGVVLAGEYRQHFGFGQFQIGGSVTNTDREQIIQIPGERSQIVPIDGREWRGHLEAKGVFNHGPNWRSSFDLAWTGDDTYLRRYDFSNLDTLISEYRLEGFFGRSYVSARTIGFQGLRLEDNGGLTGHALPLIDAEYVSNFKPLGGTIKVRGNAVSIFRSEGLDTQRASASAKWSRRWILPSGIIADAETLVRGDFYHVTDRDLPDDPAFAGDVDEDGRILTRGTARFSWPLFSTADRGTYTIEPIVEVTVSPELGARAGLVNEDSRAFELNELNLFSAERAPGYDLWEEGSRITYGVSWRYDGTDISADVLFGQSIRLSGDANQFPAGTGLEGAYSDFVGHTRITYKDWLDLEHRYRLDDGSLAFRRNEYEVGVRFEKWGFTADYLYLDRDLGRGNGEFINREDREELQLAGYVQLSKNWRLSGLTIQNLTDGRDTVQYGGELMFKNECLEFAIEIRENFTIDRDFNPGTSVLFRLKLGNLG